MWERGKSEGRGSEGSNEGKIVGFAPEEERKKEGNGRED